MEAQLNQAGTFAAQNYADSFFRQLPTDSRFLQVSLQKFPPNSSLDAENIQFNLNRFEAANVYQIQNTHLEVQISIVKKKDGSVPDTAKLVAPVANVLHSLFESVSVKVNDQPITKSASSYPYKAYITSVLTYPAFVKVTQLTTEGFYQDIGGHMDPIETNTGFEERCNIFRKDKKAENPYKSEGVRFFGKLQLDFLGCQSGLPPGTKVDIELVRSKDEFVIMRQKNDSEEYKVKLLSIFLYVPVAQLSVSTFSELERVLTSKSVAIHYRRIEVRSLSLLKGKEEYNSENLFTSDCPCRIVICFVQSKNKTGSFDLNPFDFRRSWEVTTTQNSHTETPLTEREKLMEQKLLEFEKQLSYFKSCVTLVQVDETASQKGKGRGKRSAKASEEQSTSQSFLGRLVHGISSRENDNSSVHSDSASTSASIRSAPPTYSEANNQGATKTVYIKQVDLLLNGAPLDQLETRETSDDCVFTYWKMFQNGGFGNTLTTNSITYDDFKYSFSNSNQSNPTFLIRPISILKSSRSQDDGTHKIVRIYKAKFVYEI